MKQVFAATTLTCLLVLSFLTPFAHSQKSDLSGIIDLEDDDSESDGKLDEMDARFGGEIILEQDERKKDPYKENQDATIEYFKSLEAQQLKLEKGQISKVKNLKQEQAFHLSLLYLFCSIKKGTCPSFLDTVLEIDIINSRIDGVAQCPNMKRFWKSWVNHDLEKRQGYKVKTGHIRKVQQFKSETLPRYVQCEKTVAKQIQEGGAAEMSTAEYFKERYKPGSRYRESVITTINWLKASKKKVPHLGRQLGVSG